MPYWFIVTRSFRIAWDHKYLWLLALFAGEAGGGFNFNYSQSARTGRGDPSAFVANVNTWLSQHVGLVVAIAIAWLVLVIALFILAAICEGALIRGAAEHDAERPFGLGWAWGSGVRTMWLIVRFRLLLIALALPAVLVLAALIGGAIVAGFAGNVGLTVLLTVLAVLVGLAAIVYFVYLGFLDRFGARSAVLEQRGAVASLRRGNQLLFKRLGRSLLVWLFSIGVGIAVGILAGLVLLILLIPTIVGAFAAANGAPGVLWLLVGFGALVFLVIALPVAGFINAQASTYWTLAFRRLDLDYPSAPVPAPPPAPA